MCSERKNVNLPGVVVDLPTLTEKDEVDLVEWGIPNDIDFIAASFVRKASDLDYIRKAWPLQCFFFLLSGNSIWTLTAALFLQSIGSSRATLEYFRILKLCLLDFCLA